MDPEDNLDPNADPAADPNVDPAADPAQDPTPDPTPAAPAVDVEAIRREAYEEGLRANLAERNKPAPVKPAEDAEPEVDDDLAFSDPSAYRAQMEARYNFRVAKEAKSVEDRIMARIAPALARSESDHVLNDVSAGLGDTERAYLREQLKGVGIAQLESNPALKEFARNAAIGYAVQKNPTRLSPEPAHSASGGTTLSAFHQSLIAKGYYANASEVQAAIKNGEL